MISVEEKCKSQTVQSDRIAIFLVVIVSAFNLYGLWLLAGSPLDQAISDQSVKTKQ